MASTPADRQTEVRQIPDQRAFAGMLQDALRTACPDSVVELRGSLAAGTNDEYSDIDLVWTVPDERFTAAADRLAETLNPVAEVVSVRSDPDFQRSRWRRLMFVRFAGVSLFWRLDLEMWAASRAGDDQVDVDNPAARGDDWSLPESAIMNAVATVKAVRRGRSDNADGLLARGFDRIDVVEPAGSWADRIAALADACAEMEPRLTDLAGQLRAHLPGLIDPPADQPRP